MLERHPGADGAPACRSRCSPSSSSFDGGYFDVEDFLYRLENYVDYRNGQFLVTGRMFSVVSLALTQERQQGLSRPRRQGDDQRVPVDSRRGLRDGGRCAMMTINKSNVVLVIVVVAAIAVASVVAVHGHGGARPH